MSPTSTSMRRNGRLPSSPLRMAKQLQSGGDLALIDENLSNIEARYGHVDILVNNTGGPPPPASGQATAAWSKFFQSMVLSVIGLTDRVLPGMLAAGWGRIVTSTSSGVVAPIPNLGLSNSLRMALVGWSKTLAREVWRDGITSNIILPGRIATPRISFLDEQKAKREGRSVEDVSAESTASIPVGRYGKPQEYADAVAPASAPRSLRQRHPGRRWHEHQRLIRTGALFASGCAGRTIQDLGRRSAGGLSGITRTSPSQRGRSLWRRPALPRRGPGPPCAYPRRNSS